MTDEDLARDAGVAASHEAKALRRSAPVARARSGCARRHRAGEAAVTYISAARALAFHTPLGFGTFLENYARRQGWIMGLSFISRWKWRAPGGARGRRSASSWPR